jgi:transcriptional regulator with XRE-family HTH domain
MSEDSERAREGLAGFRDRLRAEIPEITDALDVEEWAEAYCDAVRDAMRARRRAAGLDQRAVARAMDISQSAVSRLENGRGDLGLKSLYRYARAIGIEPRLPLDRAGEAKQEAVPIAALAASLNGLKSHIAQVVETIEQAAEDRIEEDAGSYSASGA